MFLEQLQRKNYNQIFKKIAGKENTVISKGSKKYRLAVLLEPFNFWIINYLNLTSIFSEIFFYSIENQSAFEIKTLIIPLLLYNN
jgi:hypothetical protein